MSDALTSNEADETTLIRCHCLAHGRRKFSELEDVFPRECQVVIEALKQVFDHDEPARDEQMSPEARLAYHRDYSGPRSRRRPLSATQHHPTTSLVGISWHCNKL